MIRKIGFLFAFIFGFQSVYCDSESSARIMLEHDSVQVLLKELKKLYFSTDSVYIIKRTNDIMAFSLDDIIEAMVIVRENNVSGLFTTKYKKEKMTSRKRIERGRVVIESNQGLQDVSGKLIERLNNSYDK